MIEEKGGITDIKVDPYSPVEVTSKKNLAMGIPEMRHLSTKSNRKSWALAKEIKQLILNVVKNRCWVRERSTPNRVGHCQKGGIH
ncbi:OLC1v1001600C1 [Oldenlandia corymbosa var. corymbosa]|uniref:OLC1v1001600C1 n=1 Tax=Oldenlandia corymbosa var. corymbosa TaxID=529605 RepID=A0AAV1D5K9_OLDCO|nr:OLC1v1001600C1 [Oldenlandia corymbosa var. corymbosa]